MARIVVAGLINIETTLKVEGFPVTYAPSRYPFFGMRTTVSGVGLNIAKALSTLGHEVDFLSLIGEDTNAHMVRTALQDIDVSDANVLSQAAATAQSTILYEDSGRRAIFVDLKDIQDQVYPPERVEAALSQADLAVLCNINFTRPMLHKARQMRIPIATDVHAISTLPDPYNDDYIAAADLLFMSHENLPTDPQTYLHQITVRSQAQIIAVGMGVGGTLLYQRNSDTLTQVPAVHTRPVVNTIGAGDALFSAFLDGWLHSKNARTALRRAVVFASYKIGVSGAADGFLDAAGLETLVQQVYG